MKKDLKKSLASVVSATSPKVDEALRIGPTPEQRRKADYVRESSKTAHGQVTSRAYRRKPLFETLAKTSKDITPAGLRALRVYRERFEDTQASETRSVLDMEERGGGVPGSRIPRIIDADFTVKLFESAIGGAILSTVRAVALEDMSYSAVAIQRYGSRKQSWIVQERSRQRDKDGKPRMRFVEKIVPRSNTHREIIRDEFVLGVRRLASMVEAVNEGTRRANLSRAIDASKEAAASTNMFDPAFFDEQGMFRPYDEIAAIIRERAC